MLEKSKLPSLKIRRLKTIVVEPFRIIHKNSPSYLHLINIKLQNYNFRSQETAVLPRVETTRYGLKSFRYNAAQIWNELLNHCRRETSLGQFKKCNANVRSNEQLMPVQCMHIVLRSLCFFIFFLAFLVEICCSAKHFAVSIKYAYRLFIIILFYFACIIIPTFSVCLFITLMPYFY